MKSDVKILSEESSGYTLGMKYYLSFPTNSLLEKKNFRVKNKNKNIYYLVS